MAQDQIEEEVTASQGQPTTEQEPTPSQESTEEAPQEATEEVAEGKAGKTKKESTALEQLAREVLADNGMDVVFATTDGTFFGRYNDARNHSRNIKDETVRYFARTGLPAEELRKLVPSFLLPEELQETASKS